MLSFHPLASTAVCREQMLGLEEFGKDLRGLNAVALALGLRVDSMSCYRACAKDMGIRRTSLLAGFWPHGEVASAHGVFRESSGLSERAVIVVGLEGLILFRRISPIQEAWGIMETPEVLERF